MTSRHWHRLARLPEREAPKTSAIRAPGSSKHCLAWLAAQWAGGCPPDRSGLRRYPGDSPFQPWTLLAITARDALTAPPRVASERSCGRRRIRAPSVDHRPRYAPGPQESAADLHRLQGAPGRRPRHRRDLAAPVTPATRPETETVPTLEADLAQQGRPIVGLLSRRRRQSPGGTSPGAKRHHGLAGRGRCAPLPAPPRPPSS